MAVYGLLILSLKHIIKIDEIVLSLDIFHICFEFVRINFFPFTACAGNSRGYYSEYGYSWISNRKRQVLFARSDKCGRVSK